MADIFPHASVRRSPYYEATVADGATVFHPYNRMLIPFGFGDPEGEYRRLTEGVSMWDVAGQRQIQLRGPDAGDLAQILCVRDLTSCVEGQGKYVAVCSHSGTLINDPVLLKIDNNCYWLSIADSDIRMWATCIAAERSLAVEVTELDVSPLAVQGPLAEDVVASILGDWVRDLRYFWFRDADIDGIPVKVARSGWSKQGGFELYLMDGKRGLELWNLVKAAGQPWGIGPGYPNPSERIESGLLSWGGDVDLWTNPFEVRLDRFVDLDVPDDVIGVEPLRQIAADGPTRHQLGVVMAGETPQPGHERWYEIQRNGLKVGDLTNGTWSYKLQRNIGFGLVSTDCQVGDTVQVAKGHQLIEAKLTDIPFQVEDR